MAQSIRNPTRTPDWVELTQDGTQPALAGIFNAAAEFGKIRTGILQHLHNDDFNTMRSLCRSLNLYLMAPAPRVGPEYLQYQEDLMDECDETGLPIPPSLPPTGSCPNDNGSLYRVFPCQSDKYIPLRYHRPHGWGERLVCYGCRRNWHHNRGTNPGIINPNGATRYFWWRQNIRRSHITVCSLCDHEQKVNNYPQGLDACTCYRELYRKRWLCRLCDLQNGVVVISQQTVLRGRIKHVRQVGRRMQIMDEIQGPETQADRSQDPWCPCGRQQSEKQPPPNGNNFRYPFPGYHTMIGAVLNPKTNQRERITQQCLLCCGYIVPENSKPTRRSARIRNRPLRHLMLRSAKTATYDVNKNGFETRSTMDRN